MNLLQLARGIFVIPHYAQRHSNGSATTPLATWSVFLSLHHTIPYHTAHVSFCYTHFSLIFAHGDKSRFSSIE
ncbi:hypothetical protein RIF29_14091 [Crotalaria pallida]|uniref:Uncharacterized protein n=1 Tax=Crotalaria pallida TaxID=3830 RepID=A0AAN9FG97_CROPI